MPGKTPGKNPQLISATRLLFCNYYLLRFCNKKLLVTVKKGFMPDTLEYIESYFQQTLAEEEKSTFEKRCETDESFAKEVAVYITTRSVLREELLAQKQQQWKEAVVEEEAAPVISISKKSTLLRWFTYAAAACLILIASMFLFETRGASEKLAANYINTKYERIGQSMDGGHDSIQTGLEAYNNKNYDSALIYFKGVEVRNPDNSDAKKYAGLSYLQQKDYNNALKEFDALAAMSLFSNSGNILKATTLLLRNGPGDKEEAKVVLKKVVDEKQDGSDDAAEWLKKL